ncbi:hypothetical protein TNCV_2956321 [Trichonephila clavipes]|nr:hypothetical protein TNCV_2956321 [Trichonephila clavipes]
MSGKLRSRILVDQTSLMLNEFKSFGAEGALDAIPAITAFQSALSNDIVLLTPGVMQDDARPHVTKTIRNFSSAQRMLLLPWHAYSPDMLPIENVWYLVGQRLARHPRPAASKDELLLRIQAIWNSLPEADIQNLFDSMPRRIATLLTASGGYTKF